MKIKILLLFSFDISITIIFGFFLIKQSNVKQMHSYDIKRAILKHSQVKMCNHLGWNYDFLDQNLHTSKFFKIHKKREIMCSLGKGFQLRRQ